MLCTTCHKHENKSVMQACHFCRSTGFAEQILCELTRGAQRKRSDIECHAFRQKLSLATGKKKAQNAESRGTAAPPLTEKQKYNLAKALQQLQRNPDEIISNMQYHLCFVTRQREQLFADPEPYIEPIVQCFEAIATQGSNIMQARLLWLAPDHVHIFLESTPDYSVDELVKGIRKDFEKVPASGFPVLLQRKHSVWEKFYFSETIGL